MGLYKRHFHVCMAITALALLLVACGDKKEQAAKPVDVLKAAFVPSADFVALVDFEAIRNTPACKDFTKGNDVTEQSTTESENIQSTTDQLEEIQKITGLTVDDIVAVLVSVDLDSLDLGGEGVEPDLSKANGVLAIQLSKPLPNAKLVEVAKALALKDKRGTVGEMLVAGQPAVRMISEDE